MTRAWIRAFIILSSLVFSVAFKLWPDYGTNQIHFPFSERTLNMQSWVYFLMEHLIAICIALCLLIQDTTPRILFWVYFYIMCADMLHWLLFFRDEGIGFNLFKVVIFIIAMIWTHFKR